MQIKSAEFIKGAIGNDELFETDTPKIVFIGRSNVGKSSVINSFVNQKNLAKSSSFPGRTQQINIFFINRNFYLIDLPGYGFANVPGEIWDKLQKMINWFLFDSEYVFKKIVLIIDAKIGPTNDDMEMCYALEKENKDIVIVANKIDKIKKADYEKQIQKIKDIFNMHKVIPYSAEKKIGVGELIEAVMS